MLIHLLMFRTSIDELSIALTSTTKWTNTLASVNEHVATSEQKSTFLILLRAITSELLTDDRLQTPMYPRTAIARQ